MLSFGIDSRFDLFDLLQWAYDSAIRRNASGHSVSSVREILLSIFQ